MDFSHDHSIRSPLYVNELHNSHVTQTQGLPFLLYFWKFQFSVYIITSDEIFP